MISMVVFSVLNLFEVLMKSLLKFVVKKVTSMSIFLLLHPRIPLPWLSDNLMVKRNKKTNGVIIVSIRITRRLRVGNLLTSLLIGSLVIFVVLIVKVFSTTSNFATASNPNLPFSPTQLDQLNKLLIGSMTSLMAHGTALDSITTTSTKTEPWIIDSNASNHMTGTRSFFSDFSSYRGDLLVKIADGSFTHVSSVGTVCLSDTFCLSNVVHVPLLS